MEITIHLKSMEKAAKVVLIEDDGAQIEKLVSHKDLSKIFSREMPSIYQRPIGLFHQYEKANIYPGLLAGSIQTKTVQGVFFLPTAVRYMDFAGEKCMLPYPSLIFFFQAKNGNIEQSKCFSVKEKTMEDLKPETVLYAYPFGNVAPNDAHICWGTNKLPQSKGYQGMIQSIEIFFSSESNKDLAYAGGSFCGHKDLSSLLKSIKDEPVFPEEVLVKSTYFSQLSELLDMTYAQQISSSQ